jgi:hypothetical protein
MAFKRYHKVLDHLLLAVAAAAEGDSDTAAEQLDLAMENPEELDDALEDLALENEAGRDEDEEEEKEEARFTVRAALAAARRVVADAESLDDLDESLDDDTQESSDDEDENDEADEEADDIFDGLSDEVDAKKSCASVGKSTVAALLARRKSNAKGVL